MGHQLNEKNVENVIYSLSNKIDALEQEILILKRDNKILLEEAERWKQKYEDEINDTTNLIGMTIS